MIAKSGPLLSCRMDRNELLTFGPRANTLHQAKSGHGLFELRRQVRAKSLQKVRRPSPSSLSSRIGSPAPSLWPQFPHARCSPKSGSRAMAPWPGQTDGTDCWLRATKTVFRKQLHLDGVRLATRRAHGTWFFHLKYRGDQHSSKSRVGMPAKLSKGFGLDLRASRKLEVPNARNNEAAARNAPNRR